MVSTTVSKRCERIPSIHSVSHVDSPEIAGSAFGLGTARKPKTGLTLATLVPQITHGLAQKQAAGTSSPKTWFFFEGIPCCVVFEGTKRNARQPVVFLSFFGGGLVKKKRHPHLWQLSCAKSQLSDRQAAGTSSPAPRTVRTRGSRAPSGRHGPKRYPALLRKRRVQHNWFFNSKLWGPCPGSGVVRGSHLDDPIALKSWWP